MAELGWKPLQLLSAGSTGRSILSAAGFENAKDIVAIRYAKEVGVPRVYLDPKRAFGGVLDNPDERLTYYRRVIEEAVQADPTPHLVCSTDAWRGMCR